MKPIYLAGLVLTTLGSITCFALAWMRVNDPENASIWLLFLGMGLSLVVPVLAHLARQAK